MLRLPIRHRSWPAYVGLAICVIVGTTQASTAIPDTAAFLAQTDSVRTSDHPRFMRMLAQLHREAPHLNPAEQWHLRFLDAWQTGYQGDYTKADVQLRAVAEHSGNATLAARASAMRLIGLGFTRRYEEAFALADRLATDLPNIKDPLARFQVLINLSQSMLLADKRDLALKYAARGNPTTVRAPAFQLLAEVGRGDDRALELLTSVLKEPSPDLILHALAGIGTLGDKRAIPVLEQFLKGPMPPNISEAQVKLYVGGALNRLKNAGK